MFDAGFGCFPAGQHTCLHAPLSSRSLGGRATCSHAVTRLELPSRAYSSARAPAHAVCTWAQSLGSTWRGRGLLGTSCCVLCVFVLRAGCVSAHTVALPRASRLMSLPAACSPHFLLGVPADARKLPPST
jgi:hypothetical protein